VVSGRLTETNQWRKARGYGETPVIDRHFPTMQAAAQGYLAATTQLD
jgi:hypothetical protein